MPTSGTSQSNGLPVKTKRFSFTKVRLVFMALWKLIARKQATSQPSNLFLHCNQTPLDVFIDVLVNKNMSRLIRFGKATQRELSEAWEQLFTEYCEISGSPQYQHMLNLLRQIGGMKSKILSVQLCITVLNSRYSSKCQKTLKSFGYNFHFDADDSVSYLKDLKAVATKIKSTEFALEQAEKEYKKLIEKTDEKVTEKQFDEAIIELSKYMGYRVDRKQVTVTEYVYMTRRMTKEYESRINKNKAR